MASGGGNNDADENGKVAGVMLGLADEGRSNFEKSYLRTFIDMASDVVEEVSIAVEGFGATVWGRK